MKSLITALLALIKIPLMGADGGGDDWMTFYYKKPAPDEFVANVRIMSKGDLLKKQESQPPIVAFLSQVMVANPGRIEGWLDELKDLDEAEQEVLRGAAWYSDTEEARAYFKKHKHEEFLQDKAPKILELEPKDPSTLDMLWGFFMATGDEKPVRRIIAALSLSKHAGAVDRFKTSKKTEQDKTEAYLDATFQSAQWSLESNCRQHPAVLKHCEAAFADPKLPEDQSLWLAAVLAKVKPDKYHVEIGSGKVKVEVKKDGAATPPKSGD